MNFCRFKSLSGALVIAALLIIVHISLAKKNPDNDLRLNPAIKPTFSKTPNRDLNIKTLVTSPGIMGTELTVNQTETPMSNDSTMFMDFVQADFKLGLKVTTNVPKTVHSTNTRHSTSLDSTTIAPNLLACLTDQDCFGRLGNFSGCLKGICTCSVSWALNSINGSLSCEMLDCTKGGNQTCAPHGWTCINVTNVGICGCPQRTKESFHGLECIIAKPMGCTKSADCQRNLTGAVCHNRKCLCKVGYTIRNNACTAITCAHSRDCPDFSNKCDQKNKTCVCQEGFKLSHDGVICNYITRVYGVRIIAIVMLSFAGIAITLAVVICCLNRNDESFSDSLISTLRASTSGSKAASSTTKTPPKTNSVGQKLAVQKSPSQLKSKTKAKAKSQIKLQSSRQKSSSKISSGNLVRSTTKSKVA